MPNRIYIFSKVRQIKSKYLQHPQQELSRTETIRIRYSLIMLETSFFWKLNQNFSLFIYFSNFILLTGYIWNYFSTENYFEYFVLVFTMLYTVHHFSRNRNKIQKGLDAGAKSFLDEKDAKFCGDEFDESDNCAICFDNYEERSRIIILPCDRKHLFHKNCILQWFERSRFCPLCKKDIAVLWMSLRGQPVNILQRRNETAEEQAETIRQLEYIREQLLPPEEE
eukprot:snap_masked-scaffold_24-processed-gene-3.28-mRNA-1 protein AED:0.71 eAED:0.71 QI:0/0/0/0.5/1/1/2/0/223